MIVIGAETLFDRSKIDWLLYNIMIVSDSQFLGIYRLVEDFGTFAHELIYNALGHLIPMLI